jgi:hypothetical protein
MGTGFRTATSGGVAAPPYTNGPYTFSEDITFEGAVTIQGTMIFGDAAVDTLTIGGTATISSNNKFYFRDTGLYLWSSADGQLNIVADTTIAMSGAVTMDGDLTIGNAGTDSLVVTAKLASQLYHNLSDTAYTVLKIHNHDTTAEIGGIETKGELINTTGSVVGDQASWSYEPTGLTGTPDGVSASSNVLAIAASHIVTSGNIYALVGEAQLYGTLNGAAVNVAGVIGVVGGNGANTLVLHMAGVQSAMSTGLVNPTTGTLSHFLANSLSTVVVDNLICMQDSEYITNFAYFNAAATDKCVEANTGTPSGAVINIIRVDIAGTPGYIPVYAAKFS